MGLEFGVERNVSESDQLTVQLVELDVDAVHDHALVRFRDLIFANVVEYVRDPDVESHLVRFFSTGIVLYNVLKRQKLIIQI